MTGPWHNGALHSDAIDPLDNPVLQRDCARELAALLEERNERALRLHTSHCTERDCGWCAVCLNERLPCPTVRALTGADEDAA